jgi:hypothetical protein
MGRDSNTERRRPLICVKPERIGRPKIHRRCAYPRPAAGGRGRPGACEKGEDTMNTLEIIFIVMTFVLPALFILQDNKEWKRK